MKLRVLSLIILLSFYQNCGHAFDLDMTVEDEIRKNYNSNKLVEDTKTDVSTSLPELPSIVNQENNSQKKQSVKTYYPVITNANIKIREGTSFNVVNSTKISDWQAKGSKVKFVTEMPIIKKKYSIPAGTVFNGEVIEVHQPQITCNGGLVVIRIRNMIYKGQIVPVNAYITRADSKMIFLNNIKGDRTYLKTMWKKGNWGRTLFNKMLTLTVNLGSEGATLILSPFPFVYGTICLGANAITSPICAFFSKGGHVSIDTGSSFRIKLLDDAFIN